MKTIRYNTTPALWGLFSTEFIFVIGLILLLWSQPLFHFLGNSARLFSLFLGFCFILFAAIIRVGTLNGDLFIRVFMLSLYFLLLLVFTKIREHLFWQDPRAILFALVCFFLFIAGFFLGVSNKDFEGFTRMESHVLVFFSVACIVIQLVFLKYVKSISFSESVRGFGSDGFNPVGIAYANMCLTLVFFVVGNSVGKRGLKYACYCAAIISFLVVLSASSRGAVLWGALSIVFFVKINQAHNKLSIAIVLRYFAVLVFSIIIISILYKYNYGLSERIGILIDRFFLMFSNLTGSGQDLSIEARSSTWLSYLENIDDWIIFGEKRYVGYPHNQWLEFLVRFGLLGIPMLVLSIRIFILLLIRGVKKKVSFNSENVIIAVLFVFCYLQSMTSLSLEVNRSFWLGLGYLNGLFLFRKH